MVFDTSGMKIEQLKKKDGKELLKEYENLDSDKDLIIECYQRAIIEKYAKEIDYR